MKYKVGDRVRIKSLDWYNENKDEDGDVPCDEYLFVPYMSVFCGKILTIDVVFEDGTYLMKEDIDGFVFTIEMTECKVEEEITDCEKCGLTHNSTRCLFMDNCPHNKQKTIIEIPEDWVLKDENSDEILTSKIILEKKQKYPKTFLACCDVLNIGNLIERGVKGYKAELFDTLQKLYICRDAYWKIAGKEMGLGKPWEPDWLDDDTKKYVITSTKVFKTFGGLGYINYILTFPTVEMRDAFYENFKEEIESCKELL